MFSADNIIEELYKEAASNKELNNLLEHYYDNYDDEEDDISHNMRKMYRGGIKDYAQKHKRYGAYIKDERFNEDRSKQRHPHSGKVMGGVATGLGLGAGALSAKSMIEAARKSGKELSAGKAALKGMPAALATAVLLGVPVGGIAKLFMDERFRTKNLGPVREDNKEEIASDIEGYVQKMISKRMSPSEYMRIKHDQNMAANTRNAINAAERLGTAYMALNAVDKNKGK